ncbi:MAG: protein kinase [Acidobacteriota bacterium]|nr:protein kinase [Acidobacteriota bacterium]
MALTPGARLGSYEILSALGTGGMGEVYRARDTKLNRDVAIKVLLPAVANDPDRLARFSREAQVLASLNHPNIAAIYGLEESNGVTALVMELVEGEDLSQRISRGSIPLDEALPIARQIAEALEAAHECGIIHRDLKPANVKVRPDGTVKVLDFGLAKAVEPATSSPNVTQSPTITTPAMTQAGMILGTAAYMSPEQARGKGVDKRADIWAFGAVLFEMLTGQRAFAADDLSMTLAAVMLKDPAWAAVPPATSPGVQQLLRRCLVKDPRQRIRDMGDVRLALEGESDLAPAPDYRYRQRSALAWASVATAVVAVAVAALVLWNQPRAAQQASARLTIALPLGHEITTAPAITRDGRTVAYVTQQGTEDSQLYLRDLNSFDARPVSGSTGAKQPFFSPDGKWVAFFAQGQLQKVEVAGGAPIRLAAAPIAFGGTWTEDNTIIYTPSLGSGLWRIPSSGGSPESVTTPDGAAKGYAHTFPASLPGGSLLFAVWGQSEGGAVLARDSRQWQLILPSTTGAPPIFEALNGSMGRLLVADQAAGIRAAPFDAARPARTSADASVLANVHYDVENETRGWLAVSETGTAVYAPGDPAKVSLVWVDREGKIDALGQDQDAYREASLSPDGTQAVVRHGRDLWVHDLRRGTRSRLTSGDDSNVYPMWSRDGTRIMFASNRGGDWDIYAQRADGSQPAEALLKRPSDQFPASLSADGTLLFIELAPTTGRDLWTLSPDGRVTALRVTAANEAAGQFSPGGTGSQVWLAYESDESGRSEVYVQPYPGGTNRIPVSTGGGFLPTWSRDGKELIYVTGDAMVAVSMRPDGSFGVPRRLFDRANYFLRYSSSYDVSLDGKRFLMIRRDPGSVPRQLNVILNWTEGSKK